MCDRTHTASLNNIMLCLMQNEESQNKPKELFCNWCGKLLPVSSIKVLVCPDCYKLLLNAGISEKEIFQEYAAKTKNESL